MDTQNLTFQRKTWQPSHYSQNIEGSKTLAVTARVAELRRQGVEVISLGAGEPDFNTPAPICEAAVQAIRSGHTKYTPNAGIFDLRQAIAEFLNRMGGDYAPEDILVSNGAKQSIVNALFATLDVGDEVLVPVPYWTSYPEQVKMAGGNCVFLQTTAEHNYKIYPEQLEEAVTAKTRLLILNSPSNPTGMVYTRDELEAICHFCLDHDILILSDEIYIQLIYDAIDTTTLAAFEEIREQLMLVNGFSKSHAMTGWRLGYLAAKPPFIQAAMKIQSHTTSNACSISQYAALAALQMPETDLDSMKQEFRRRRDYTTERLMNMPGISLVKPQGAFYLFPSVAQYFGRQANGTVIRSAMDLSQYLLDEARIAVVPGEAFGAPENIRISYATSLENLQKAMDSMEEALSRLQ
ncbi:MAG: pyridoxal phosphate-dependent aminotransferase [candidate division KSB1 bacterium]|nr:pyridoxal phosphate-dependent aminotransferase [candidate division KSB1 bacterium]